MEFDFFEFKFLNINNLTYEEIESMIEKLEIPVYYFKTLSSLKQNISSVVIVLLLEGYGKTEKAFELQFKNMMLLSEYLKEFGELEYYEEIKFRNNKTIIDNFQLKELIPYDTNYILTEDLFKIFKNHNIKSKVLNLNFNNKKIDDKEKLLLKPVEIVFEIVRKKLYNLRRKSKVSYQTVKNYIIMVCIKNKIHLGNSTLKYLTENIYIFLECEWFETEKERQRYWYEKRIGRKVGEVNSSNRIKKTAKTRKQRTLNKIIKKLLLINKNKFKDFTLKELSIKLNVDIKTLKSHLKENKNLLNLVKIKLEDIFIVFVKEIKNNSCFISNNNYLNTIPI